MSGVEFLDGSEDCQLVELRQEFPKCTVQWSAKDMYPHFLIFLFSPLHTFFGIFEYKIGVYDLDLA
jgi:hypothetical protein